MQLRDHERDHLGVAHILDSVGRLLPRHDDLLAYGLLVGVLLVVGLRAEGDDDPLAPLVPLNHEEGAVLVLDDVANAVEVALRAAGRGPPRLDLLAQGLDLGYY